MKIIQIKVYQPVQLGPHVNHTLMASEFTQHASAKLVLEEVDKGIFVTTADNNFLVPWNNVVFVKYEMPKPAVKSSKVSEVKAKV